MAAGKNSTLTFRIAPGLKEALRQDVKKRIEDQRGLAASGYTGNACKHPQRKAHMDVLQVVGRSPLDDDLVAVTRAAPLGNFNLSSARQVLAG